jgi:hypothetical protein
MTALSSALRASAPGTSSAATGVANNPRTAMFIRVLIAYLRRWPSFARSLVGANRGRQPMRDPIYRAAGIVTQRHVRILTPPADLSARMTKARRGGRLPTSAGFLRPAILELAPVHAPRSSMIALSPHRRCVPIATPWSCNSSGIHQTSPVERAVSIALAATFAAAP